MNYLKLMDVLEGGTFSFISDELKHKVIESSEYFHKWTVELKEVYCVDLVSSFKLSSVKIDKFIVFITDAAFKVRHVIGMNEVPKMIESLIFNKGIKEYRYEILVYDETCIKANNLYILATKSYQEVKWYKVKGRITQSQSERLGYEMIYYIQELSEERAIEIVEKNRTVFPGEVVELHKVSVLEDDFEPDYSMLENPKVQGNEVYEMLDAEVGINIKKEMLRHIHRSNKKFVI